MSTFVLVHGAWHGAWCWERLEPELAELGHRSIAMDLPIEDGSATFADYAQTVIDAASGEDDDIVLVGHSLGAMVVPLVAAARPAAAVVSLCGVIPKFGGMPWDDAPEMAEPGTFDATVTNPDGSTRWPTVEAATKAFYPDCTPEDAAWAFAHLRNLNNKSLWDRPYPLDAWPDGRRVAIVGLDDGAVTMEFSRHVCSTRLGVEPIELPGGHSPFLARPKALADALVRATAN